MRILAALSGGVDSAVAAARLLRDGAEVIGVHLRTGVESDGAGAGGGRSCCGADDARDARAVAARLGLPFYVVDVADAFRGVLEDFRATYGRGETPNPCVLCNRDVKFGRLARIARDLGCEAVATGHYAVRSEGPHGRLRLLRARDAQKDQTYVLYPLDQDQLQGARFPLGDLTKSEVRAEARALGLGVAAKPDSQDLCFAPDGDWRRALDPASLIPGEIVRQADGLAVGRHDGAAAFTLGQRRRLPALGQPHYVVRVEAARGRVEIGPREALLRRRVRVGEANWIEVPAPGPEAVFRVEARIRHAAPLAPATLVALEDGEVEVCFETPVFAPAPGQALVAYVGPAVLCGGRILGSEA